MYFNNVHILNFVIAALLGLVVGKFIAWCNLRIPEKKKVFSREFFKYNKEGLEYNYIFMIIMAILYIALLYKFGIKKNDILKNLDLIKFLILMPMIVLAFFIDFKHRIIPNRLNLTLFEVGLGITFVYGITNVNMAKDYILGMVIGAIVFIAVTLLGKIASGKEAMGLGDIKFIGALGLYFGINSILEVILLSFVIAAFFSIILLFVRLLSKNKDRYIAFGPFIALSTIICIFMPSGYIVDIFLILCKTLSKKVLMF